MELHDAALYFDDIEAFDAYTGELVFLCQFSNFDDRSADGTTSKRRVLSIGPNVQIPARRVLILLGEQWIVGDGNSDAIFNETIRQAFSMKKANFLAEYMFPGQLLDNDPGTQAYAQAVYFKDQLDLQVTSDYSAFYNIFFADNEPIVQGTIIKLGERIYRTRNTYKPLEGYVTAQCDELEDMALTNVLFSSGTYDPISDSFTANPVAAKCLRIDYTQALNLKQPSAPRQEPGEEKAFFSITALPNLKAGDLFVMDGENWRVVSAVVQDGAWLAQIRRGAA